MQTQTVDVVKRMKEITLVMQIPKQVLEARGVTSAVIEGSIMQSQIEEPLFFFLFQVLLLFLKIL